MPRYQCKMCNETKSSLDFLRSRALWFPNGVSDICESCLESRIDSRDLNQVDKILQYLDIPFNPNEWMDMYESNGDRTLGVYVTKFFAQKSNRNIDWTEVNNVWREKQKNNTLNKEINVMNEEWLQRMREVWGDNYDMREYESMEALYDNIQRTQNVITKEKIIKWFDLKTESAFEKNIRENVKTRAEKQYLLKCIKDLKLNDYEKIKFCQEYCKFSLRGI